MTASNTSRHFVLLLAAALLTRRAHPLVLVLADFLDKVDACFCRTGRFFQREVWLGAKAVDCAV